jgi:hypothetical protein
MISVKMMVIWVRQLSFLLLVCVFVMPIQGFSFSLKDSHPKIEYKEKKIDKVKPKKVNGEKEKTDRLQEILNLTNKVQAEKKAKNEVTYEVSCEDDQGQRYRTGETGYQQCLQTKMLKKHEEERPLFAD